MNGPAVSLTESGRHQAALRWVGCAATVLVLHAALFALVLRTAPPIDLPPALPEAVLLDLSPEPAAASPADIDPPHDPLPPPEADPPHDPAPQPPPDAPPRETSPTEPPPTPVVVEPDPVIPIPSLQVPLPQLPLPPLPRPAPPPTPVRPARQRPPAPEPRTQPSQEKRQAMTTQAAAPSSNQSAPAMPPSNPNVIPTWQGDLIARLQKAKHYPAEARSRGVQGLAVVTFTMDRTGRVLAAALVRGSGNAALDEEAVALIHRAEPLPAPPAEVPGDSVTLSVPVNFALH